MTPPNRKDFVAAYIRRIHHLNRSLEQLARMGRGVIDQPTMEAVWEAQRLLFQAVKRTKVGD